MFISLRHVCTNIFPFLCKPCKSGQQHCHSPCGYSQLLYSGGRMRGQVVGTGVALPSVKKGMVAPVETQKSGAELSAGWPCWPWGRVWAGAWLNAPGDMAMAWPDGSCWEWLLVGISSLLNAPAPCISSSSSSAGGALGTTGPGLRLGMGTIAAPCWRGPGGGGLVGVKLTAMFPM